jgi:carbonic anhydrase
MNVHARANVLLAAAVLAFAAPLASAQSWNHDPASGIGPNAWGALAFPFATCGAGNPFVEVGRKQSPVDIVTRQTVDAGLPALSFHYQATPFVVENTGHVVEVPYAPGSTLRVGQDSYDLLQFHFHAPSEHTVDGRFAAAEIHLVHRNELLDLAVVGVLVDVGNPVNTVVDQILRNASEEEVSIPRWFIDAQDVLPAKSKGYYTYSGSLTTPPCSEGVRWFALKEPVFVSREAIDRLHEIIAHFPNYAGFHDNNRPVRPLNGRAILNRKGK